MSETTENIIVLILMVAIVIGLLCFVGFRDIKDWLSTPFTWKENEKVNVYFFAVKEAKDGNLIGRFAIENKTGQTIEDFEFLVYVEGVEIELCSRSMSDVVETWENYVEEVTFTTDTYPSLSEITVDEQTFEKLANTNPMELDTVVKTVYLRGEEDVLVKNNGTWKIIIILASSLALGLLGFVERFPVWLRIILKVCGLPCLVGLSVVLIIFALAVGSSQSSGGGSSSGAGEDAKRRYKRAAQLKAGAEKTGNKQDAARAQAEMDRAMADMLTANGSGSSAEREAAARYKRAANHKAGAIITGRTADAASAQAEMDRALSDMIKKK